MQPVLTPDDRERFCSLPGPGSLSPDVFRQAPDASWMLCDDGRFARCSLWWSETPPYGQHRVGLVGHYAVSDAGSSARALMHACDELRRQGCTIAIGPMDGSTWQRYRLVTERGDEPMFFLEPDNPDDWPRHFLDAGFTPLAQYFSALTTDLATTDPRMPSLVDRVAAQGVRLRTLHLDDFDAELRRIHALSLESFRDNFLYTPLDEERFVAQYQAIRPFVRPEMVLLAEKESQLIGLAFNIPDVLQARRGLPIDTFLVKTLAVHPVHMGIGLGSLLMAKSHEAGRALGYRRAIHALMHESNASRRISSHTARTIRRYTLYARPL